MKKAVFSAVGALVLALGVALGVAMAADEPELKEGLWSVHTQTTMNPGNRKTEGKYTICRNHAFDQSVRLQGKHQKGCTTATTSLASGKFSSSTRCLIEGAKFESTGITT